MNLLTAFLGLAAYGTYTQAQAARQARSDRAEQAIAALQQRAAQLQERVQEMELDAITEPGKHSAKQLRAARRQAEQAEQTVLLAQARQ